MSHQISLASLIIDFKRAHEGSNIDTSAMLSVIAPMAAAYIPPLPAGAVHAAEETYNAVARKFISHVLSDVGELCIYNTTNAANIAKAIYVNRYQTAYSGIIAPELPSPSEIVKAVVGDLFDVASVMLWYPRFNEVFTVYYKEMQAKGE